MTGLVIIDDRKSENISLARALTKALQRDPVCRDHVVARDADEAEDLAGYHKGFSFGILHVSSTFKARASKALKFTPNVALIDRSAQVEASDIRADALLALPASMTKVVSTLREVMEQDFPGIHFDHAGFEAIYRRGWLQSLHYNNKPLIDDPELIGPMPELLGCMIARAAMEQSGALTEPATLSDMFLQEGQHVVSDSPPHVHKTMASVFGYRLIDAVERITKGAVNVEPVQSLTSNMPVDYAFKLRA